MRESLRLVNNPLVGAINDRARSLHLPQLIMPAIDLLNRELRFTQRKVREINTQVKHKKPELECKLEVLEKQIASLIKRKARTERLQKHALDLEKPLVQKSLLEVNQEISKKQKEIEKYDSSASKMTNAAKRLARTFEKRQLSIAKILAVYPEAHVVDLSCLQHFKNHQGLPALALYSTRSSTTSVTVTADQLTLEDIKLVVPKAMQLNLAASIQVATGVRVSLYGKNLQVEQEIEREINRAKECKTWKGDIESDELPAFARSIELKSDFSDSNGLIPQKSRKIIQKALLSKLFDDVLLLTEVKKWSITYTDLNGSALLEGALKMTPQTRDPLVLGIKIIAGQTVAMLLHAFDTTSLERSVGANYATKPNNK